MKKTLLFLGALLVFLSSSQAMITYENKLFFVGEDLADHTIQKCIFSPDGGMLAFTIGNEWIDFNVRKRICFANVTDSVCKVSFPLVHNEYGP